MSVGRSKKIPRKSAVRDEIPGKAYTVFTFDLPYSIPIPDGTYKVRVGRHVGIISTIRVQKDDVMGGKVIGTGAFVLPFDKYGRASFSSIAMELPWKINLEEKGRKALLLGDAPPRLKAKEIALRFLNRLINTVRYVTEEFWLEPARYQDISSYKVSYRNGKKQYPATVVLLDLGLGGFGTGIGHPLHPFQLEAKKLREIKKILGNELKLDAYRIFLLNSKDACLQEDFRRATIEAVVALETVLYEFIRNRGRKIGITERGLKNFIHDVGLTGNINVVLKILTKDLPQIDEKVISKCKEAITARNKILHEGLTEIPSTQTEQRIVAIEKMIAYLNACACR